MIPSHSPAAPSRHSPAAIADRLVPQERRRGRGAATNASGRFEILAREDFDDGWTRDEAPDPARHPGDVGEAEERHHPQRIARHRLRPVDQSLSRLRARLLLLLRPSDPRLSRPFARARFREPPVRQAGRREAARARARSPEICACADRARHEHRSLSADRAAIPHHPFAPRNAAAGADIRRPSSPSRTSSCAISTS